MKAIKSVRELARLAANADGKNLGIKQADGEKLLRAAVYILAAFEVSANHEGALKTFNEAVSRRGKELLKLGKK